MMLDALSSPQHTDMAVKNGGRAGKGDGAGDDFSGALSKLGRENSTGDKGGQSRSEADAAADGADDAGDIGPRVSSRMHIRNLVIAEGDVAGGLKRVSVNGAFPEAGGKDGISLADKKLKETIVGEAEDGLVEAMPDEVRSQEDASSTADAGAGTSDLLTILANPGAQHITAANGTAARGIGEGRKTDGIRGREAAGGEAGLSKADASDMLDMPTDEIDPQRRSIRFVNAKDGNLNGELTAAANGSERNAEGKGNTATTDNVMVIDSRRYLGLAGNSNSGALVTSMTGDSTWSSAMQPGSLNGGATGSTVHVLKLQMNPHDLGSVTATLRLIGEELHVQLTVETRAAFRQLSDDSNGMLDALKSQGFSVDQITINIASSADTDAQKGQQGNQLGQQMAGNGERNSGAPREQSNTQFGAETDGGMDADGGLGSDDAASAGSVGPRSGQLYL